MMEKGQNMLSREMIFCAIFIMVVAIFGCAHPEVEQMGTVSGEAEVQNSVSNISTISTERLFGKMRITIEADSELSYTAFKLNDPLRLVLDLPNMDTSKVSEISYQDAFPLTHITPFRFTDGGTVNSRIEIALSRLVPYQVFSDANRLFIDLETPMQESDLASGPSSSIPPGFEELTPVSSTTKTPLRAEAPVPVVINAKPNGVQPLSTGTVSLIQPVSQSQTGTLPTVQIEQPPQRVGNVSPLPVITGDAAGAVIQDLHLLKSENATNLVISSDVLPEFEIKRSQNPARLTIDLKQSNLPAGAEKVVSPDGVDSTVKQARLFQLRRSPDGSDNVVRILVDLLRPTAHEVSTEPGKLVVKLQNQKVFSQTGMTGMDGVVEVPLTTGIEAVLDGDEVRDDDDAFVASEPTIRAPKTGDEEEYKGQPISLHFQEADVLDVLQVIAEVSGLNLVVHPEVSGTVTVHLTNIPWDQALDIILKMNDLSVEIEGTILRVAQASVFQDEIAQRISQQQQQIQARKIQEELEPLETKLITINFADPESIVEVIDEYFAGSLETDEQDERRGTITVDSRTKTLIIQDTADNITQIEQIVETLDRRTPQVMIEAKIVTLSTLYVKELGIQWLGNFNVDSAHGNSLPFRWPFSVNSQSSGGADSGFGVNLPGLSTDYGGTTGWLRFGSIDDVFTLFAKIDAAEVDNKGKTLSQPKVFTQDNVAATVTSQQTRTVPAFGDNTESTTVTAPLSLSVTPRISNDGYITMIVNVNNTRFVDSGDTLSTTGETLTSQVTVKDGSTVVVGGIFVTNDQDNFAGVPGLHKIPIIGHLFKSTTPHSKSQSELLVFLTPRILDRNVVNEEAQSSDVSLSY
ncbi:hypothetical protein CSA56_01100 [candidate division KSB3 bacterium]|uniref:Secretin/TonB short N-terminal domain-containing protein n=1 Tax=candidate division KSB3 bacterium TaxID=2044937 RepID=A0A2G6KKK3_9BACT|nr:MAG: hypothetical protein CSA56_01100 [candidate division KSB3 bacterium]